ATHAVFGLHPLAFHVVNVTLHVIVTSLLHVFMREIDKASREGALGASLLFAVHPIHTEAVTGLVGRADVLCAAFFLSCLMAYRRAIRPNTRWHNGWLLVSVLMATGSMLSKEHGITSLALCGLIEVTDKIRRILTRSYVYSLNLRLLVFPSQLSHDWSANSITLVHSIFDVRNWQTLFAFGIVSCVAWTASKEAVHKRQHRILCSWMCTSESQHHTSKQKLVFLITLCSLFGVKTVLRNRAWQNRDSLIRSGLHVLPHNAKLHYNFGNLLKDTGRSIEAMNHYEKAIKYWPEYSSAHNNLGTLLSTKDASLAEWHFRSAVKQASCHSNALFNLGNLLIGLDDGRTEEGVQNLLFASRCDPMSHLPHVQLGLAFHHLNKPRQSIEHFNRALSLKPEDADIMYNLAYTYNIDGQHSKAADMAHKCTDADHQSVKCLELLSTLLPSTLTAKLYLSIQSVDEIHRPQIALMKSSLYGSLSLHSQALFVLRDLLSRASLSDAEAARVHLEIGKHCRDIHLINESIHHFEKAVQLNRDDAESLHYLAVIHHKQGLKTAQMYINVKEETASLV
ncbi:hypothetical protein CAPTEDRAFT_208014, partial [Capitella teleta]